MKKLLLALFTFAFTFTSLAQAPPWVWGRQGNGGGEGIAVTTDADGNAFLAGDYGDGNATCSIQFGTTVLNSNHYGGTFLTKYNSAGNVRWAKGSEYMGFGNHLTTDNSQSIFMIGTSQDSLMVFGADTLLNYGLSMDAFVVKYDSSGNELWARSIGGPGQDDGIGIATDASGNVFVAGETYSDMLNFQDTAFALSGYGCIFIAKYDNNGNLLWEHVSQDSSFATSAGVVCDTEGNAYIVGSFFTDSITFGSHTLYNSDPNNFYDLFLVKYDSLGNISWARSDGNANDGEQGFSVSSRITNDRIVLTGVFGGTAGWAFGSSSLLSTSAGGDFFLAEYDTAGNPQWASQSSGTTAYGYAVDADAYGNACVSGGVDAPGTLVFGSQMLFYPSTPDQSFLAKFDSNGSPLWAIRVDNAGDDQSGIAYGNSGDIFFGGDFLTSAVVYGPDSLYNVWSECPFIAKMNPLGDVGMKDELNGAEFRTFPNPFNTSCTIQFSSYLENAELTITDVSGREITNYLITGDRFILSRGDMKAGIYFASLISNGETIGTQKLIITD